MQNRINDQAAFILHTKDYQDNSLILDLFSEQFGRISVLAKAAKKRRDTAHFQICNRLLVGWSGTRELKILTQIESRALTVPTQFYPGVFYINELLIYLLPKDDEQSRLFQSYQNSLLEMAQQGTQLEPVLRNFEIELLSELGYMPDLLFDNLTEQPVDSLQSYRYDVLSGIQSVQTANADHFRGSELMAIHHRQFDSVSVLRAAKRLMRKIIDYNLQGRTLQSRKFYQQMTKKL